MANQANRRNSQHLLDDVRAWVEQFHSYVIDKGGRRKSFVEARTGDRVAGIPPGWADEYNALDEVARLLGLELGDTLIPAAVSAPDLKEPLCRAQKPLRDLRDAVHDIFSERDLLAEYQEHRAERRQLEAELRSGEILEASCVLCLERFDAPNAFRAHFEKEHPAPSSQEEAFIDPAIHARKIDSAVGPCQEVIKALVTALETADREASKGAGGLARDEGSLTAAQIPPRDPGSTAGETNSSYSIWKFGKGWRVRRGDSERSYTDMVGFYYCQSLVAGESRSIGCSDLKAAAREGGQTEMAAMIGSMPRERLCEEHLDGDGSGDAGEISDRKARGEYRTRLQELTKERSDAERIGDQGRLQKIDVETTWIESELSAAQDKTGRPRVAGDRNEQARQAVFRGFDRLYQKLAPEWPGLVKHLRDSIETGGSCRYAPSQHDPVRIRIHPPENLATTE